MGGGGKGDEANSNQTGLNPNESASVILTLLDIFVNSLPLLNIYLYKVKGNRF